jgi:hypothetical protein
MKCRRRPSAVCSLVRRSAFEAAVLLLLVTATLSAQLPADSAHDRIERAFAAGDVAELRNVRAHIERSLAIKGDPWLEHYYGFALFRESLLVDEQEMGIAHYQALLSRAENVLRKSAERLPLPETYALLARVLGRMLSIEPDRGAELGPQQGDLRARAERLAPDNPRIWLLRGVSAIYTPAQYGGGIDRAHEWLQKAVQLYENDTPASPAPRWGRSEAQRWLAEVRARKAKESK